MPFYTPMCQFIYSHNCIDLAMHCIRPYQGTFAKPPHLYQIFFHPSGPHLCSIWSFEVHDEGLHVGCADAVDSLGGDDQQASLAVTSYVLDGCDARAVVGAPHYPVLNHLSIHDVAFHSCHRYKVKMVAVSFTTVWFSSSVCQIIIIIMMMMIIIIIIYIFFF